MSAFFASTHCFSFTLIRKWKHEIEDNNENNCDCSSDKKITDTRRSIKKKDTV